MMNIVYLRQPAEIGLDGWKVAISTLQIKKKQRELSLTPNLFLEEHF